MPVVYIPQDTRIADSFNNALNTFVKTKMYSDDKKQKEAAYKLQTLMELGGQTNDLEIADLEKTLNLAPGQLAGVMKKDPTTGLMKLPGRLERESTSALNTYEKQARIGEKLEGEFAPSKVARKVKEIGEVGPATTAIEIDKLKQTKTIESENTIDVARKLDSLKQELADKNLTSELRREKLKKLDELDTELLINEKKATSDPATKLTREKTRAEIDKLKAEAKKEKQVGDYYEGARSDEAKAKADKAKLDTTKESDVKMDEVNKHLVSAGLATMDDKGKIRPKAINKNDPRLAIESKSLKDQGYDVSFIPVEKGSLDSVKDFFGADTEQNVYITVAPGKLKKTGASTKAVTSNLALTPIEEDTLKRMKMIPENKKYTDDELKKAIIDRRNR